MPKSRRKSRKSSTRSKKSRRIASRFSTISVGPRTSFCMLDECKCEHDPISGIINPEAITPSWAYHACLHDPTLGQRTCSKHKSCGEYGACVANKIKDCINNKVYRSGACKRAVGAKSNPYKHIPKGFKPHEWQAYYGAVSLVRPDLWAKQCSAFPSRYLG